MYLITAVFKLNNIHNGNTALTYKLKILYGIILSTAPNVPGKSKKPSRYFM